MSDMTASFETQPQVGLMTQFTEQNIAGSQQLATAQIQSRYAIARRFPRDIEQVRQNMLKECHRPSFCMPDMKKNGSSVALYRVPRAGTNIEGVTIRFAEMAARNYGNFGIDIQQIGEDQTQRIYLVTATDYENNLVNTEIVNVPRTIERKYTKDTDTVLHSRTTSKNETVYTLIGTDDDIAMKRNALLSKAKRNLIMGFIPGWLVEECVNEIRATAAKKDAEDPDAAKRVLFDAFASVGVNAAMLAEHIGHTNQLQPAELEELRGYFGALKEGYTTWAEIAAAKHDDQDGGISKQLDELIAASGRTPAQRTKLRASYAGRPKELIEYLQKEAAKKADTGAAAPQQQEQAKAEPPAKEAQAETTKAEPKVEQKVEPALEQRKATSAPAPVSDEWEM